MARKATDLLDVFRFSGEASDGGGKKPPSKRARGGGKGGGGGKKPKRSKRRFEGIFLNRRQLLLTSSALALLLVLSFTLGLATGRPGGESDKDALARSSSALVTIRARLPVVDPATRRAVRPAQVEKRLRQDYGIRAENIRISRDGTELVIDVGPFGSEADARRYIQRSGLDMAHIHMENPFRYAEFVPWERRSK